MVLTHAPRIVGGVAAIVVIAACSGSPDPRHTNFRVQRDNVTAHYDEKSGELKLLEVDTNKNGKVDSWTHTKGVEIIRVDLDKNEDGTPDRWEYYTGNKLEKVGSSSLGDGKPDQWAFQSADGHLQRIESDTDRDGRVDQWEIFRPPVSAGGSPVLHMVETDPQRIGRPTARLIYAPDGTLERSEAIR